LASNNLKNNKTIVFTLFFLFSNAQTTKYLIKDLFSVRQGKLVIHGDKNANKDEIEILNKEDLETIAVLTLQSVNWELSTIKAESLLHIPKPKSIPLPLSSNDFIINRVGQTRGCSFLQSDFDFKSNQVIPSHHFVVCTPRKIILDKLPFFHAVLEIYLNDLITKKIELENSENLQDKKAKSNYVTVKEIENIEVEIPSDNFDMITSEFNEYYNNYAASYKNFMISKEALNNHKLELAKFLKKENDWNKK